MTNIAIPGKIVSIEVEDKAAIGYAAYEDGLQYIDNNPSSGANPKTLIEPTGAAVSIIVLSHSASAITAAMAAGGGFYGFSGFILSDDFEVGDVVEIYTTQNPSYNSEVQIQTGSNHNSIIATAETYQLIAVRKLFSGTARDWFGYR